MTASRDKSLQSSALQARAYDGSGLLNVLAAAFGLSVAVFAYAGVFARYVADDFCTSIEVQNAGMLGAQVFWFTHWTGRFAFVLLIDALDTLGAWTVPLTPLILLFAWLATLVAALARAWARLGRRGSMTSALVLSLAAITLTLGSATGLWQALYWQTGSVTYLLPIVLMTAYAATLWRVWQVGDRGRPAAWGGIGLGLILVVLAVGCSETAMGMVVSSLFLGAAIVIWQFRESPHRGGPRQTLLFALTSALLAALLASLVVIVAPGNALRLPFFHRPPLLVATFQTAWFPFLLAARFVVLTPLCAIGAYVTPYLVGRLRATPETALTGRPYRGWRRLVIASGVLIVAASGSPSFFAGGDIPPDRALIIPQFVLVATLMGCGLLDGLASPRLAVALPTTPALKRLMLWACIAVTLFVPLTIAVHGLLQVDELGTYAAALDSREHQAQAAHDAGSASVTVEAVDQPSMVGLAEPGPDPKQWPNSCIAPYYGLDTFIVASTPS